MDTDLKVRTEKTSGTNDIRGSLLHMYMTVSFIAIVTKIPTDLGLARFVSKKWVKGSVA